MGQRPAEILLNFTTGKRFYEHPIDLNIWLAGFMNFAALNRQQIMSLPRDSLRELQLAKLNALLRGILPANRFYAEKFAGITTPFDQLEKLSGLPFTTKEELLGDEPAGIAKHLTFPLERYTRFHRTSGSRGRRLAVLDTADDWRWWIETWQYVLDAAGIVANDRVVMAFSFGPFVGFWSAHDAVIARGALVIPTGGMSSQARLDLILSIGATAVFCTPSYALHLAQVARIEKIDLQKNSVRVLVVAGEPGGSIPSVRQQIESAWGAKVHDHCGATEIGPWGFADLQSRGVIVNEAEFIAEYIPINSAIAEPSESLAELVLTALGRVGAPVIRYRTGDLVRPVFSDVQGGCPWVLFDGGVLGRVDDMIIIRGVNIYPSSVEQIVREFADVDEFRLVVRKQGALDQLTIEVEDRAADTSRIAQRLQLRLGLSIDVVGVPVGSLPRSEGKAARFVDLRNKSSGGGT